MKLLVVDDEAHIRQMMRLTLVTAGYQVEEAATGEAALALFGDGRAYDAVLLDQKMPGIDGLQTLRQMKNRAPEACVVMVTAFASIDLALEAIRLGAADFVRKPMTPEMLRSAVAAALASRSRTPLKGTGAHDARVPAAGILTLNGFQVTRPHPPDVQTFEHVFQVTHFPDGRVWSVTVAIAPEAVDRVARLSHRTLRPGGAFWRGQAERRLSAFLWSEGQIPEGARLALDDVPSTEINMAAAWERD